MEETLAALLASRLLALAIVWSVWTLFGWVITRRLTFSALWAAAFCGATYALEFAGLELSEKRAVQSFFLLVWSVPLILIYRLRGIVTLPGKGPRWIKNKDPLAQTDRRNPR